MYDLIVIGGGPAGATFARNISDRYKTLLIDRTNKQGKCCGGLIAPDAQKMLASFDMGIPRNIMSDPQLFYVRAYDLKTGKYRNYQRHYTNVNRSDLDNYLLESVPQTVEIRKNTIYISHEVNNKIVTVFVKTGDIIDQLQCKILVGADGAYSQVRKTEFNDFKKMNKYLAIQGEYENKIGINHFGVFFHPGITDFYSWLIPKSNKILIGGAFIEGDNPRKKYHDLIQSIKSIGYEIDEPVKINASYLIRPGIKDIKTNGVQTALIGEAAGFISPSSAEGLSYAYKSAFLLTRAMNISFDGWSKRYQKYSRGLKINIFQKSLKGLLMYNEVTRNIIFRLNIGSVKIHDRQ
ncbi:MAG: FAD-dependent monooxygenase [Candidatus Cloacimonetes bacterium]|nr:FAD-dependent monooxygenase [Candidatus Cloacimonadota bacterium]